MLLTGAPHCLIDIFFMWPLVYFLDLSSTTCFSYHKYFMLLIFPQLLSSFLSFPPTSSSLPQLGHKLA